MKYKKIIECTLLLITHERPKLAIKSLKYYKHFFLNIKILDSSKKENKHLKNNFEYYHCKNYSIIEKILLGLSKTKTKYTIISPDDDFLFPDSVKKGIDFLEKNNQFVSTGGRYYSFEKFGFLKKFNLMYKEGYSNISEILAQNRLKKVCNRNLMQMTYNLLNTSVIIKYLSKFKFFKQANFIEDTITLANILFGKHKNLDVNWMVRDGSVNTNYFDSINLNGLYNFNKKENNFILKKFFNVFLSLLKEYQFKFDKKKTLNNLKIYFSKSKVETKKKINNTIFTKFIKKIYKSIWYSFFIYRYWVYFSQNEKKFLKLIFK